MTQIGARERTRDDDRGTEQLTYVDSRNPYLPETPGAADPDLGLGDAVDRHAHGGDVVQADRDPCPAASDRPPDAVDIDLGDDAVRIAERIYIDVGHVAWGVEADLDPAVRRRQNPVGHPRGGQRSVERGDRRVVGELELAGRGRGFDVLRALEHRDGLGVTAGACERVHRRRARWRVLRRGQCRPAILLCRFGEEHSALVGVGDHEVSPARRVSSELGGRHVACIEDRSVLRERPERGHVDESLRAAVDDRGRACRVDVDDPTSSGGVIGPDLRQRHRRSGITVAGNSLHVAIAA